MSRAGRPSMTETLFKATAGDVLYGCRLRKPAYTHLPQSCRRRCRRCNRQIVVTPSVLAEKRARALSHGRRLVLICDDCLIKNVEDHPTIVAMPDEMAVAEARRINGEA